MFCAFLKNILPLYVLLLAVCVLKELIILLPWILLRNISAPFSLFLGLFTRGFLHLALLHSNLGLSRALGKRGLQPSSSSSSHTINTTAGLTLACIFTFFFFSFASFLLVVRHILLVAILLILALGLLGWRYQRCLAYITLHTYIIHTMYIYIYYIYIYTYLVLHDGQAFPLSFSLFLGFDIH